MDDYDELLQRELESDLHQMIDEEMGHHLVHVVVAVELPEDLTPGMAVRSITDLLQERGRSRSGVVFSPGHPQAYMSWLAEAPEAG